MASRFINVESLRDVEEDDQRSSDDIRVRRRCIADDLERQMTAMTSRFDPSVSSIVTARVTDMKTDIR